MRFPPLRDLLDVDAENRETVDAVTELIECVLNSSFQRWYHAKEFTENIQNGQSYFNRPGSQTPPLRHSPSQLLQCHRKIYYRNWNAPKEVEDPTGIFWTGEHVETELIVPYLRDLSDEFYVQNSIWVDFTIESNTGDIHIKGETDPVFVDADGTPILLTEIKTKDSIDRISSPSTHHIAQAHSYMYGLTQKFDHRITDALIIYAGRSTLNLKVFHEEFDPVFWRQSVLDWATSQSVFQINEQLPPADPEFGWECQFCSYRHRCGKELDGIGRNSPPRGLLPLREYPERMVVRHLESHRDADLKLTPTVAYQLPQLAKKAGIYDWRCESCNERFDWRTFEPGQSGELLQCPHCQDAEGTVRGPTPREQVEVTHE